jgi:hypothetical protein
MRQDVYEALGPLMREVEATADCFFASEAAAALREVIARAAERVGRRYILGVHLAVGRT